MGIVEIILASVFLFGMIYLIYLILREPILLLKSFLRGMISSRWEIGLISSPIWVPIWILDKLFNLRIFIKEFTDASKKELIVYEDYRKYIIIRNSNVSQVTEIINEFYDRKINSKGVKVLNSEIMISNYNNSIYLKIGRGFLFEKAKLLHYFINNSELDGKYLNARSVFLNTRNPKKSFFLIEDSGFEYMLVGKNRKNKKIYVNLFSTENDNAIFYNTNIDYLKRFSFKAFERTLIMLRFEKVKINTCTQ